MWFMVSLGVWHCRQIVPLPSVEQFVVLPLAEKRLELTEVGFACGAYGD